jgi:hypothetical protein
MHNEIDSPLFRLLESSRLIDPNDNNQLKFTGFIGVKSKIFAALAENANEQPNSHRS